MALVALAAAGGLTLASANGGGGAGGAATATPASATRAVGFGGGGGRGDRLDADVRALAGEIRTALLQRAPAIVNPIIDSAASANRITAEQATQLREALAALVAGNRPDRAAKSALLADADVRAVVREAYQAVAREASGVAEPLIAAAVTANGITEAQATALRARLQRLSEGRARGFGRAGGRGFGRRGGARLGNGVLRDVRRAVAAQAPRIGNPIVAAAVTAGSITEAQGTTLREALQDAADGSRDNRLDRALRADADVRTVLRDIRRALARETPAIAAPVIAQAVTDGDLTSAQAERLRARLARIAARAG